MNMIKKIIEISIASILIGWYLVFFGLHIYKGVKL